MQNRIIQFLHEKSLSSTKFADSIGVQRSSISHILSGRNKPSFDFIEKMLNTYPELNAQWLITGKGIMFTNQPLLFTNQTNSQPQVSTLLESNIPKPNIENDSISKSEDITEKTLETISKTKFTKDIERIVVFYTNNTFKEYQSE